MSFNQNNYGSAVMSGAAGNQMGTQPPPIREGGLQTRLLDIFKLAQEAQITMAEIERSTGFPMDNQKLAQAVPASTGPMNVDRMVNEIRDSIGDMVNRLQQHCNRL